MKKTNRAACLLLCLLASRGFAQVGEGEVTVVPVPEHAGPYVPGEHVTVDVFLEHNFDQDLRLDRIRFDFADSDSALVFDSEFTFDLTGVDEVHHESLTTLPVVWLENTPDCVCPEIKLPLGMTQALRIGSFGVTVPAMNGNYAVDLLNADEPSSSLGALCTVDQEVSPWSWSILRANEGTVVGEPLVMVVETPPIPAATTWGMIILIVVLVVAATLMLAGNRTRSEDEA